MKDAFKNTIFSKNDISWLKTELKKLGLLGYRCGLLYVISFTQSIDL